MKNEQRRYVLEYHVVVEGQTVANGAFVFDSPKSLTIARIREGAELKLFAVPAQEKIRAVTFADVATELVKRSKAVWKDRVTRGVASRPTGKNQIARLALDGMSEKAWKDHFEKSANEVIRKMGISADAFKATVLNRESREGHDEELVRQADARSRATKGYDLIKPTTVREDERVIGGVVKQSKDPAKKKPVKRPKRRGRK